MNAGTLTEGRAVAGKQKVYQVFGEQTALFPLKWGTKDEPLCKWTSLTLKDTKQTRNQNLLNHGQIGVALGPVSGHLVDFDFDDEKAAADFAEANPWVEQTTQTRGRRGRHYFVRIPDGDYRPKADIKCRETDRHLGEFRSCKPDRSTGYYTVVCGIHPDTGQPYHFLKAVPPKEIRYSDIQWPLYFELTNKAADSHERNELLKENVLSARRRVAEDFFQQEIEWIGKDDGSVFGEMLCPHANLHTQTNNNQQATVFITGAPNVFCFHTSCKGALAETSHKFRAELRTKLGIELPGGTQSHDASADLLFRQLSEARKTFRRDGVGVTTIIDGRFVPPMNPAEFINHCEQSGAEFMKRKKDGGLVPEVLKEPISKVFLANRQQIQQLPEVRRIVNAPFLYQKDGECIMATPGFNVDTKTYVTGSGDTPFNISLDTAVESLLEVFGTCSFHSETDKARAVAYAISPALLYGNFFHSYFPLVVLEADEKGAGKGYLLDMVKALYNSIGTSLTQRQRAVSAALTSCSRRLW